VYGERPDPCSDYRAGLEIRTRKRCEHIEVRTHAEQEIYQPIYEYEGYLYSTGNTKCAYVAPGTSDSSRIHW
jgi:hypothetical protein